MRKVWVNGTFDLLHYGHIKLLEFAKTKGDILYVGIDSDERIKQLKGSARPINNQITRLTVLESIRYVDVVYVFDSDSGLSNLINHVSPDFLVIGSDYLNKKIIGSEYAKEIVFFDRISEYSTTNLVKKCNNEQYKANYF